MNFVGRIIIACMLTVFALSTFIAIEEPLAQCKPGKVEIVMTTPSGRTKTKCVSYHALPGILNAAEVSQVSFISQCPCYTKRHIERIDGVRDGSDPAHEITYFCTYTDDPNDKNGWAWISEIEHDTSYPYANVHAVMYRDLGYCEYDYETDMIGGTLRTYNRVYVSDMTPEQEQTCYDVIRDVCGENPPPSP